MDKVTRFSHVLHVKREKLGIAVCSCVKILVGLNQMQSHDSSIREEGDPIVHALIHVGSKRRSPCQMFQRSRRRSGRTRSFFYDGCEDRGEKDHHFKLRVIEAHSARKKMCATEAH